MYKTKYTPKNLLQNSKDQTENIEKSAIKEINSTDSNQK